MYFKGSMVALVTPMDTNGALDKAALKALVDWHLQSKTNGIIVAGTTGEAPTLSADEKADIISSIVKQVNHRIPVIAGTGTNATLTTLTQTEQAKKLGVDACLIVTPYYNKPTQEGLFEHFKTIASSVDIPIILYNVPGRTCCDLLPETAARLSKIRNIVGIKEATGKIERVQEIAKLAAPHFEIYSGDDATALAFMEQGAIGVISVTANICPLKMADMCEAALAGDLTKARKINEELSLLHQDLFIESNPIPAKWALHLLNKIQSGIRLPLLPLSAQHHNKVRAAMKHAGILELEPLEQNPS